MPHELLLTEPRSIRLGPYEDPPVAPDQVRAEAIVSGISHGTELALFRGISPFDGKRFDADLRLFVDNDRTETYPMRLGYEWVGTVRETGAAVRTLETGDVVHLALPHRETQTLTVEDDPRSPLTALPKGLGPERAALLQSTTIALQAIHDARLKVGDTVADLQPSVVDRLECDGGRLEERGALGTETFRKRCQRRARIVFD